MWQTLFTIPYEVGGVPLFGVGVLLALWAVFSAILLTWLVRRQGWNGDTLSYLPVLGLLGAIILFLPAMMPEGLPIRGYGTLLLVAIAAAVGLAVRRGRRMGLSADLIFALALWAFVPGILGARLFHVIEYWDRSYKKETAIATIRAIVDIPNGGLVVFGSVIGGAVGVALFVRAYKLPGWAVCDLAAPCFLLGQAIGRVGCLMNGCCYGGRSDLPWAIRFPSDSPPYNDQLAHGLLRGSESWSLPVHPAQIYGAIDAGLLCAVLWFYYPFRRRDGEVMALLMTLHPISRILLEIIRTDEQAVFGTGLSISQVISVGFLAGAAWLWLWLRGRPVGVAYPLRSAA